jgi:predicted transcriptional regulator
VKQENETGVNLSLEKKNEFFRAKRVISLRRSKLEMYIDILSVLAQKEPLKVTHIMHKANINCSILKGHLNFLIQQGLIEEHNTVKQQVVYAVTQRGKTVLKHFTEIKQVLRIIDEAQKQPLLQY